MRRRPSEVASAVLGGVRGICMAWREGRGGRDTDRGEVGRGVKEVVSRQVTAGFAHSNVNQLSRKSRQKKT